MNVLVCGGRDYSNANAVFSALDEIEKTKGQIRFLIHGSASGADELAAKWMKEKIKADPNRSMVACPADWASHGRAAGPIRNQWMLDQWKPQVVVAFPSGRGTADMVSRARLSNVPVIEINA